MRSFTIVKNPDFLFVKKTVRNNKNMRLIPIFIGTVNTFEIIFSTILKSNERVTHQV